MSSTDAPEQQQPMAATPDNGIVTEQPVCLC